MPNILAPLESAAWSDEEVWRFFGCAMACVLDCLEDFGSVLAVDDPGRVGVRVMNLKGEKAVVVVGDSKRKLRVALRRV